MDDAQNIDIEERLVTMLASAGRALAPISRVMELLTLVDTQKTTHAGMSCADQAESMLAYMLSLEVDDTLLISTLLYPFVQYGELPIDSLTGICDRSVILLIEDAQQIHNLGELSQWETKHTPISASQSEVMRKMLLAMISDVRAVVMRLVEQLAILSHCKQQPDHIKRQYAEETRVLFAPLANRLGLGQIKWQLEDYVLRYLEPETYRSISQSLNQRRALRERYVNLVLKDLRQRFDSEGIVIEEISGRAKHINSIYLKMQRKQKPFAEIYDMIAIRIIVRSIDEAYHALSVINQMWPPIESEFDDYIAAPKPNGYQSIHTAVLGPQDRLVEIQIRTVDMDKAAEYGVAAHWLYKESSGTAANVAATTNWLEQLLAWQADLASDQSSDIQPLHLFKDRVFVFTPSGEVKDLDKDATPIDFAYSIHTDVGHRCCGARINKKMVPLNTPLSNGDQVEILTTKLGHPSRDWLSVDKGYIKTARAKAKVQHWFRMQEESRYHKLGIELVERGMKRAGISRRNIEQLAKDAGYPQVEMLYIALGRGEASINTLLREKSDLTSGNLAEDIPPIKFKPDRKKDIHLRKSQFLIKAEGLESILSFIAQCCKPIPGDDIIGYITRGRGLAIHQQLCPNITRLTDELKRRCVTVKWHDEGQTIFPVDFTIITEDKNALMTELTHWLGQQKIALQAFQAGAWQQGAQRVDLTLELGNLAQVNQVLMQLQSLPQAIEVKRGR